MLRAKKYKLFRSRVIHFWTRIWSGRGSGYRVGSEAWDDGNTSNSDECKTPGSDSETLNIIGKAQIGFIIQTKLQDKLLSKIHLKI